MMLPLPEMAAIFLVAIVCSAGIGIIGVGALWLSRRRSLRARLSIIVATTLVSVLTGMVAISAAMYLSEHDLYVFLTVALASLLSTMVVTWFLGRLIAREYEDLRSLTAEMGEGHRLGDLSDPKDVSETALLRAELVATSRKLADSAMRWPRSIAHDASSSPGSPMICELRWPGSRPWPRLSRTG